MTNFVCPGCGKSNNLELISDGGVISAEVIFLDDTLHDIIYQNVEVLESFPIRFQCYNCGYILYNKQGEPITEKDELYEWLEDSTSTPIYSAGDTIQLKNIHSNLISELTLWKAAPNRVILLTQEPNGYWSNDNIIKVKDTHKITESEILSLPSFHRGWKLVGKK